VRTTSLRFEFRPASVNSRFADLVFLSGGDSCEIETRGSYAPPPQNFPCAGVGEQGEWIQGIKVVDWQSWTRTARAPGGSTCCFPPR